MLCVSVKADLKSSRLASIDVLAIWLKIQRPGSVWNSIVKDLVWFAACTFPVAFRSFWIAALLLGASHDISFWPIQFVHPQIKIFVNSFFVCMIFLLAVFRLEFSCSAKTMRSIPTAELVSWGLGLTDFCRDFPQSKIIAVHAISSWKLV